jgi:lipid II:glycine glycyltransferase (peptidoglycan interpeptide bridge formation enzyme)
MELPAGYNGWVAYDQYSFHVLDLRPSIEELYSRLHYDSMQRKIRRADRESVVLEQGRSDVFLKQFYALLLLTRRRHGLPPQPFAWFQNLVDCLGDRLTIRLARVNDRPIASILTLRHKQTIVYKYGCSDERFHKLGGMPRLFWQTIEEARLQQLKELDLGRSDQNNPGLIQFKDRLGATKTVLNYWRFSQRPQLKRTGSRGAWKSRITHSVLANLPDGLLRLAGEIFYRHAG